MYRKKKLVKAVCVPVALALGTAATTEPADNPHVEPMQHEEEPRLTYDTPYTTTSSVVVNFPLWDPSLADIPVAVRLSSDPQK
jgi:hypothetical protein